VTDIRVPIAADDVEAIIRHGEITALADDGQTLVQVVIER